MTAWRTAVVAGVVASAGVAGTIGVAAATGMPRGDLEQLLGLTLVAATVTLVAAMGAQPLLRRSSMRQRFVAVAVVSAAVALANLFALTQMMFLSSHDAALVGVLLLYAVGAGVGAAVVLARSSAEAIRRLAVDAAKLGTGQLDARVGALEAGSELDTLARTLDEMAERVQRALEQERRADTVRRDLIIAVSHDLRTPLASLRAMIEAVDDQVVDDGPTLRRYATEMRRSVLQLSALVEDLFEFAQLDAGAIEAESRLSRVDDIVRAALVSIESTVREKGLSVVTDIDGVGDASCSPRLARVLQNLLVNAVRHTPADGTVRLTAATGHDRLEVTVLDTGEGIPADQLDQVFDPFFRADPARSGPGAGLGLALAKRIVEELGGRISVESTPAVGSRFAVMVPLRSGASLVRDPGRERRRR
jgi:signal transduction histidine kinase